MASPTLEGRSAHCAGRCSLVWTEDGKSVITCGEDGLIKVHVLGGETKEIEAWGGNEVEVVALARHGETLAFGATEGPVKTLSVSGIPGVQLKRFQLSVTDLAFSPDGAKLAMASENKVEIVEVANPKEGLTPLRTPPSTSGLRSVSWSPDGSLLAGMSPKGEVLVWRMGAHDLPVRTLKVQGFKDPEDEDDVQSTQVARLAWRPATAGTASQLALPGEKEIRIVNGTGWGDDFVLGRDVHKREVAIVAWSPNGMYLAAAELGGNIVVYDAVARNVVRQLSSPNGLRQMAWSPCANSLAMIDIDGLYTVLQGVLPPGMHSPIEAGVVTAPTAQKAAPTTTALVNPPAVSLEATAASGSAAPQPSSSLIDDAAEEAAPGEEGEETADAETSVSAIRKELKLDGSEESNTALSAEAEERMSLQRNIDDDGNMIDDDDDDRSNTRVIVREVAPKRPPAQEAFMPSSSPMKAETRILSWNAVGVATSTRQAGDLATSVLIEFANQKAGRNIKFTDPHGYCFAALAPSAAFFASAGSPPSEEEEDDMMDNDEEEQEDMGTRSTLFYRPFNSVFHDAQWTVHLPKGEQTELVACGSTFCAAATSKGLLRLFRPGGTQEAPHLLPGSVITMVASGPLLLIVYHRDEPTLDGVQRVGFELLHTGEEGGPGASGAGAGTSAAAAAPSFRVLATGRLPLAPEARISWCGFGDVALGLMPLVLDSDGLLLALSEAAAWKWVPVLDTASKEVRKSNQELIWPVSVRFGKLMAVVLKGEYRHKNGPSAAKRPVLQAFELRLPIAGVDAATRGAAAIYRSEESSLRAMLVLRQREWGSGASVGALAVGRSEEECEATLRHETAELDKKLVKQAVVALRLGKDTRALSLAWRLRLPRTIEILLQKATELASRPPAFSAQYKRGGAP